MNETRCYGWEEGSLEGQSVSPRSQRESRLWPDQLSRPCGDLGETVGCCTHRLCNPLAEDGQQEEGGDGRGQVAGNRLDVVKQLPAVGALDDGDP